MHEPQGGAGGWLLGLPPPDTVLLGHSSLLWGLHGFSPSLGVQMLMVYPFLGVVMLTGPENAKAALHQPQEACARRVLPHAPCSRCFPRPGAQERPL
jgi:hypothetical protein